MQPESPSERNHPLRFEVRKVAHWCLLLPLIFAFPLHLFAQFIDSLPPYDLKFSHQIESALNGNELSISKAAYYYTYIGEYGRALETLEVGFRWGLDTMVIDPRLIKLAPAIPYLTKRLSEERLIIVSEAHQKPQHRLFTKQLALSLAKSGFRHLGLEALTNMPGYRDSLLNQRGYPLNSPYTGTYTREPLMADLLRETMLAGYEVFGIDKNRLSIERDTQMATNIIAYLDEHPHEKVIAHVGWYHAVESDFPKRKNAKWMAHLIRELSDYDPLTIYQDVFSEKYLEKEFSLYTNLDAEEISVVLDMNEQPLRLPASANHFDIHVFHPRTSFMEGRPNWLYEPNRHKVYIPKDLIEATYPIIIRAVLKKEFPEGVPLDIIEIRHRFIRKPLLLNPGNYKIKIIGSSGQSQWLDWRVTNEP